MISRHSAEVVGTSVPSHKQTLAAAQEQPQCGTSRCRWKDETDAVLLEFRYGNKPIVIADNKSTMEVGTMDKLPKVIDMAIAAVSADELDRVLKAALGERRVQPRKVS